MYFSRQPLPAFLLEVGRTHELRVRWELEDNTQERIGSVEEAGEGEFGGGGRGGGGEWRGGRGHGGERGGGGFGEGGRKDFFD